MTIPYSCKIIGWYLISTATGSIQIDVQTCLFSSYPNTVSIAGTELPTLSNANKNSNLTIASWTHSVNSGTVMQFIVNTASNVTFVNLTLQTIR